MYNLIKKWYHTKDNIWYHNDELLDKAVAKNWITQEQKDKIKLIEE